MAGSKVQAYVIGVGGGSGSGKTTVVHKLADRVGRESTLIIHHDSYYRDRPDLTFEERCRINFDHPDSLETELLITHIRNLRGGTPIEVPIYDFSHHTRVEAVEAAEPMPIIIVEGILVLAEPKLRELMDLKVYVDTDADLRLVRRMRRDVAERGRTHESVVDQYLETVKPMHEQFVDPSKRFADLIVPEGGNNHVAIGVLVANIQSILRDSDKAVNPASLARTG